MKTRLLTESLKIARSRILGHPQYDCYLHYSFVVQDNKIVSWATNGIYEPPLHYGYHRFNHDGKPKYHSELWAYRKARKFLNYDCSFEVINIRLNKSGGMKISCPCKACYRLLTAMGCNKFVYSSEVGFLTLS